MLAPFTTAAKEEMLSAFAPWCADECISAFESQSKKPHQGVAPQNLAQHQGIAWSNSTTALGLRSLAVETRVRSRCTGKERDAESGLDNFGARYDASSMGRFMTPDWAASPEDVPYASFGNPQSLNLYSYALNNPLKLVDTDGHDLVVAAELQNAVTQLRLESPSFNAELAAHEGPNNPNLTINTGNTPNDPNGSPSIGNTSATLTGGPVQDCSPDCVSVDKPCNYKGATVTVNDSVTGDKSQTQDVLGHEVGHVHDARTNTDQYHKDSQHTKDTKGKTPHDDRPEEQRANQFKDQTNQEKKQWEKDHCHGFFHKTCS